MIVRLAALLASMVPGLASANVMTMTFDQLGIGGETYVEDGITASGGIGIFDEPGYAHMDRQHVNPRVADFTTGGLFAPLSVDIRPDGSGYCTLPSPITEFIGIPNDDCPPTMDQPIPYIWLSGFVDDVLMSTFAYYQPRSASFETIDLSSFGQIDRLRVEVKTYVDLGLPGSCVSAAGCGHFDVDNLVLLTIPEPASFALIAAGLVPLLLRRVGSRYVGAVKKLA